VPESEEKGETEGAERCKTPLKAGRVMNPSLSSGVYFGNRKDGSGRVPPFCAETAGIRNIKNVENAQNPRV